MFIGSRIRLWPGSIHSVLSHRYPFTIRTHTHTHTQFHRPPREPLTMKASSTNRATLSTKRWNDLHTELHDTGQRKLSVNIWKLLFFILWGRGAFVRVWFLCAVYKMFLLTYVLTYSRPKFEIRGLFQISCGAKAHSLRSGHIVIGMIECSLYCFIKPWVLTGVQLGRDQRQCRAVTPLIVSNTHCQWPWLALDWDFKVAIFFDNEYLRNDTR